MKELYGEASLATHYIETGTNSMIKKPLRWLIDSIKSKQKEWDDSGRESPIMFTEQEVYIIKRYADKASKEYEGLDSD